MEEEGNKSQRLSGGEEMITGAEGQRSATPILTPGPNAMDISPDGDGGILKEIITEGSGNGGPLTGDKVFVHYVGRLTDGSEFDSSRQRGDLFEFTLGKGNVIKAWDIGVATMKKGEVCVLHCKSEYAYGESGSPPKIPPNSTLVFEIELFYWEGEDLSPKKDKGILRRRIEAGEGYATPNEGAMVSLHLIGRHEERVFEERDVTFPLGEGCEVGIVEGVERAVEKFSKGEKSLIQLQPKYAFGSTGSSEKGVPGNAIVEYEVTLTSFENAKDNWEMEPEEKLEQAKLFKTKGTTYFKDGKYKLAVKQYKKIVSYLEQTGGDESENKDDEKAKEISQVLLSGHLNLAMCYLKMNELVKASNSCDKALEMDPGNEKGLFRRGMARVSFNEIELAKEDFEAVQKIDPTNKAAANQIILCNRKLKEQYEKERKLYSNMFTKFAKQDANRDGRSNRDVLENPGTWGEDDSHFRQSAGGPQGKPDNAGDGGIVDVDDEKTKRERFIESVSSENIEMIPWGELS